MYCILNCKEGYWSNFEPNYTEVKAKVGNDQRCTFDNCKAWEFDKLDEINDDWESEATKTGSKKCTACWSNEDVITNYDTWDVKKTYSAQIVIGVDADNAIFELSNDDKWCKLNCK